jgi:hypothetical protein
VVFRKAVNHPGTAERPFMAEARRQAEQAITYGAEVFVAPVLRGA